MDLRHSVLWVDMTVSRQEHESVRGFEEHFDICRPAMTASLDAEIERLSPRVLCFDFDFPTKSGLKSLQHTKQTHPRIPILMLTVQHSEALAVWAFRSRVWDYLVKPIARQDLNRCLIGLTEILEKQDLAQPAREQAQRQTLIPDENRFDGPRGSAPLALAPAIEYVEKEFRNKVSGKAAAAACKLTPFQFSRMFRETYQLTFQDYLLRYRIREACRHLKNPSTDITDVALFVGFNDVSYFGKIFRRYMQCSPSQFITASQSLPADDLLADLAQADQTSGTG